MTLRNNIRNGTKNDARDLAHLINMAGEGLPEYLWSQHIEKGKTAIDVGETRAKREEGGFSYLNARTLVTGGKVAGACIAYKETETIDPNEIAEFPPYIQPLVKLEAMSLGSYYLNALAVYPNFQGKGYGKALMNDAEKQAKKFKCEQTSLIVSSANRSAFQLYCALGYKTKATEPLISWQTGGPDGEWVLMTKDF